MAHPGNLDNGKPYTIDYQASPNNSGATIVAAAWMAVPGGAVPAPNGGPVAPGGSLIPTISDVAPILGAALLLRIHVDAPDDAATGTLTIDQPGNGKWPLAVTGTDDFVFGLK